MQPIRWGVVGVGRAGRARVAALRADPRAALVAGWRGALEDAQVPEARDLDDLFGQIQAVAICAPDAAHPDLIRRALDARLHTLCEFPAAPSASQARALIALAAERGRVFHVEHIELLTATARWIRSRAAGRHFLGGSLRFLGPPRPDGDDLALANIARLHRLVDAVGLPRAVRVFHHDAHRLEARLDYEGGPVQVEFEARPGARRRTELVLEFHDGTVTQLDGFVMDSGAPVSLPVVGGLFEADQLAVSARIFDELRSYVSDERVVDVLALAQDLTVPAASPPGSSRRSG